MKFELVGGRGGMMVVICKAENYLPTVRLPIIRLPNIRFSRIRLLNVLKFCAVIT